MSKTNGYRAAIRDRLRKCGIIYEVLRQYKRLTEFQDLIYENWIRVYCSNEEKTRTLKSIFYRGQSFTETDLFMNLVPWHVLTPEQKQDYERIAGWIKNREYECC